MGFGERYKSFDRFQQRHRWLGFTLAVFQKYSDDDGGSLAATISYYAFFSIFPLLLVFTTLLGYVLDAERRPVQVARRLGARPVPGHRASAADAFAPGQRACARPRHRRGALGGHGRLPRCAEGDEPRVGRALHAPSGRLPSAADRARVARRAGRRFARDDRARGARIVRRGLRLGVEDRLDRALDGAQLRALLGRFSAPDRARRDVEAAPRGRGRRRRCVRPPGARRLVCRPRGHGRNADLRHLRAGDRALSWVYLAAHITLLAAEANVVATRRLWPRSFSLVIEQPPTEADRKALTQRTKVETAAATTRRSRSTSAASANASSGWGRRRLRPRPWPQLHGLSGPSGGSPGRRPRRSNTSPCP